MEWSTAGKNGVLLPAKMAYYGGDRRRQRHIIRAALPYMLSRMCFFRRDNVTVFDQSASKRIDSRIA